MTTSPAAATAEASARLDLGSGETSLGADTVEPTVKVLKAVADPVRLRLLDLIAASPSGEACLCDLIEAFDISQPTMSHHLKLLHGAGLLDREKRGSWAYYRLRPSAFTSLSELFAGFGQRPLVARAARSSGES